MGSKRARGKRVENQLESPKTNCSREFVRVCAVGDMGQSAPTLKKITTREGNGGMRK